MSTPQEIEKKFWSALKSDRTMMLGLDGVEDGYVRPMTAQFDDDRDGGPLWFFTARDHEIVRRLGEGDRAIATFMSKNHSIFATVQGHLSLDENRAMIDKLWNPYVAAWYEGGKTDPKIALLRLDPEKAEVWEDASSLLAGLKMLFGADPKKEYRDKQATLRF